MSILFDTYSPIFILELLKTLLNTFKLFEYEMDTRDCIKMIVLLAIQFNMPTITLLILYIID